MGKWLKEADCQREERVVTKADLNSTMFSKGADTWVTPLRPSPAANPIHWVPISCHSQRQPAKTCICMGL